MNITAAAYSSKGSIRAHNEDSFLLDGESGGGGIEDTCAIFAGTAEASRLFFVADGMGGHAAGDIASAFVSIKLRDMLKKIPSIDSAALEKTVRAVHVELLAEAGRQGTPNMGSTLAGIVLGENDSGLCNVGDSRVYRLRNGYIQQLSHDDSLSSMVPDAAKNIITNAMGAGLPEISVETRFSPHIAVTGDVFLVCSDGVHGFISDDVLEQMLSAGEDPAETARKIVKEAILNNSDDNCTALVVQIGQTERAGV